MTKQLWLPTHTSNLQNLISHIKYKNIVSTKTLKKILNKGTPWIYEYISYFSVVYFYIKCIYLPTLQLEYYYAYNFMPSSFFFFLSHIIIAIRLRGMGLSTIAWVYIKWHNITKHCQVLRKPSDCVYINKIFLNSKILLKKILKIS